MKIIKVVIFIFFISIFSCKNKKESKKDENKIPIEKKIEIKENRQLQFLYFSNGGLIGYFDDGTIVGCPRCDLMNDNIEAIKTREPHSKFKIENGILISEQGDSVSINSMRNNEWAIVNYKSTLITVENLNNKEKEITGVALSFHKWYIKNTNYNPDDNSRKESTSFDIIEGENGKCKVDYNSYFNQLRKLGTISEKFIQKEKERTSECANFIETVNWGEYSTADAYTYDEFCGNLYYLNWTKSQENTENLEFFEINAKDEFWNVIILIDNRKVNVKIEREKEKYMITQIDWIEE